MLKLIYTRVLNLLKIILYAIIILLVLALINPLKAVFVLNNFMSWVYIVLAFIGTHVVLFAIAIRKVIGAL